MKVGGCNRFPREGRTYCSGLGRFDSVAHVCAGRNTNFDIPKTLSNDWLLFSLFPSRGWLSHFSCTFFCNGFWTTFSGCEQAGLHSLCSLSISFLFHLNVNHHHHSPLLLFPISLSPLIHPFLLLHVQMTCHMLRS